METSLQTLHPLSTRGGIITDTAVLELRLLQFTLACVMHLNKKQIIIHGKVVIRFRQHLNAGQNLEHQLSRVIT